MKKNNIIKDTILILAGLIILLIISVTFSYASDVTGARYISTVRITSNTTSTTENVCTTFMLNTGSLLTYGYADNSSDFVIQSNSGGDAAFMPSNNSTNPWCLFIPLIGPMYNLDYHLYSGNTSGGKIRYFPGAAGMVIEDSPTIELGDNFSIGWEGYVDTTISDNIVSKGSFYITTGAGGFIDAYLFSSTESERMSVGSDCAHRYWNGGAWVFSGPQDPEVGYLNAGIFKLGSGIVFRNIDIPQGASITAANVTFTAAANMANDNVNSRLFGQDSDNATTFINLADFEARPTTTANVTWDTIAHWVLNNEYTSPDISAIVQEIVDRIGWTSGNSICIFWEDFEDRSTHVNNTARAGWGTSDLAKAPVLNIDYSLSPLEAAGVASGDVYILVSANQTDAVLSLDGVEEDTTSLPGALPDNSDNWTICSDATPYMKNFYIQVDGLTTCNVTWEYTSGNFTDQSGNNNDACPSYRSAPSNADITAVALSFSPTSQRRATPSAVSYEGIIAEDAPEEPETMYSENTSPGLFFAPLFNSILDAADIDRTLFWYPFAYFVAIFFGALTFKLTKGSLLLQAIVEGSFILLFALPGINVYGIWTVIYFGLEAFGIIVMSKHFSW